MTVPVRPPRVEGLRTLGPELTRIVDALARVQEEKDHRTSRRMELPNTGKSGVSGTKP